MLLYDVRYIVVQHAGRILNLNAEWLTASKSKVIYFAMLLHSLRRLSHSVAGSKSQIREGVVSVLVGAEPNWQKL